MEAVNYSKFRERMKAYCDEVSKTKEAILVKRKDGDVIVMSVEEYNDIKDYKRLQADRLLAYVQKLANADSSISEKDSEK